jgi:acyl-CoA hydrolase
MAGRFCANRDQRGEWPKSGEGVYTVLFTPFPLMSELLDHKIARAETRVFKAVFPNTTNHYDTLFGGTTLHMMDEVAFITATRFSRLKMVTVSSDKVDFTHPIPGGSLVELIGSVVRVGNTSLQVRVDLFVEQMYSEERHKAVSGLFTFVAIDQDKRPVRILQE